MKFALSLLLGRRATVVAMSVLALGVAVAACGSSSASSSSSSSSTGSARYHARLNLAKCFRSHGINIPDPSPGGGEAGGTGAAFRALQSYPQSQIQAVLQDCRQYLAQAFPQLNLTPQQRAQVQQQLVRFAECMRSHGVNVPDPTFNGNGVFGFKRSFGSVDRNSPAFRSAMTACQSLRPQFGRGGGGISVKS
jgi:hypothetical protein